MQHLVTLGERLLEKRDDDGVRSGLHLEPKVLETPLNCLSGGSQLLILGSEVFFAADGALEDALAVDGHDQLMRKFETFDVDLALTKRDVELVLTVQRKVVANHPAATRTERHAFDIFPLRPSAGNAVHVECDGR